MSKLDKLKLDLEAAWSGGQGTKYSKAMHAVLLELIDREHTVKPKRSRWHEIPGGKWPREGQEVIVKCRNGDGYDLAYYDNSHRWQWEIDFTHWRELPQVKPERDEQKVTE